MTKHVMSLTYEPKIKPVREGRCSQTIRKGRRFKVDDSVLMHGWTGRPYASKWSWRMRVNVAQVIDLVVDATDVFTFSGRKAKWTGVYANMLAEADYIDPPTGLALRDVLFGLNGAPDEPEKYQIVRW